ncbi:unnamed protein product [Thelazia callipaeda]|uniref:Gamma-soluble NSF attachment protein n=1 Tax=Thelazia callipaeda TaxID=103827 RepID=A0A0N5CVG5_THECL|nr:unnamed protein product [Thelazia callipaeda]
MDEVKKRRISEAKDCIKKAEAHLKTSILKIKFKPDYDSAAMEYDRAAICFKNASEIKLSCDAYLKAAEMHKENGNLFHWAKCNENAAMLLKDMGDSSGALKYMNLAADGYAESGSSDTSAMVLNKAAKCLEDIDCEKAIESDRSRMAGEFMSQLTRLYLKLKQYNSAADMISEEIEKYMEVKESGRVRQLTVALVLVQLALDDPVAATKSVQKFSEHVYLNIYRGMNSLDNAYFHYFSFRCDGFGSSEDANVCNALISAFESHDNHRFQQILQSPILRTMDNEYLRLMKSLKAGIEGSNEMGQDYKSNEIAEESDEDLK